MKKRNAVIALAIATALAVPFSVFAATSDTTTAKSIRGFFGIDVSKLTDQQKADVNSFTARMADLQKQFIDQMVKNGTITQAQGDAEKSRIDAAVKSGDVGSFFNGMGRGFGKGDGMGGLNIDISNLTDQQKADLKATVKKIIDLEKGNITKAVANGLLTAGQGAKLTSFLDSEASKLDSGDATADIREFAGGFGDFMFFGRDMKSTTALTDQQKADLTAFVKDLASLRKELINQLVSDGILTKAQGDSENSRIDEMTQAQIDNGFTGGMIGKGGIIEKSGIMGKDEIMGKGGMAGFRGRGIHGGSGKFVPGNNSTGAASSTPSTTSTGTSASVL